MRFCKFCNNNHDNWYRRPDGKFECRVRRAAIAKKHHLTNAGQLKTYKKQWQQKNAPHLSVYQKERRNGEAWKKYLPIKNQKQREKNKQRYAGDLGYRLERKLRRRLWEAIKHDAGSTYSDSIGCTKDELIKHLESLFHAHPKTGQTMTWNNYGTEWHIDHKQPLFKFDLSNSEQFKLAANYRNLQPLWKEEHSEKTKKDLYANV